MSSETMVNNKVFECKVCNKVFGKKSNLAQHAKSHRKGRHLITKPMKKSKALPTNIDSFVCGICAKSFPTQSDLDTHENIHFEDGAAEALENFIDNSSSPQPTTFSCSVCDKTFPSKFKLIRHAYIHLSVKPFPCDRCGRRFSRKDHLQVHYRIHTGEKICYCVDCGQGFNTTNALHRHIARLHAADRRTYLCAECDMEFAFKSQLKRHFDRTHRTSYTCEFCGNVSLSEDALYRHLKKHILTEPFVCLMCSAVFNSVEEMSNHQCCPVIEDPCKVVVRITLADLIDLDYEIDPIDEMSAQKLQRKFDSRGRKPGKLKAKPRHNYDLSPTPTSAPKEYSCRYCEKSFASEANKIAHELMHVEGQGSLTCSICQAKFSTTARLVRHLRIHTGENPYRCKFCSKAFPRRDYLKNHMISVHATDEQTCPFCFTFCVSSEELAEHIQTHQDPGEGQSHYCDTCPAYFESYSELQAHMLDVHACDYLKCQFCDKSFFNKAMLAVHENVCLAESEVKEEAPEEMEYLESPQKPFQLHPCRMCDAVFSSFLDKLKHIKVIHKPAFYDCDVCPCKFASSTALRNHKIQVHHDEDLKMEVARYRQKMKIRKRVTKKPKSLKQDSALNMHRCKDCDFSFPTYEEFIEHAQMHSYMNLPDEELQCVLCDETFLTTDELTEHLQNHDDNMIVEVGVQQHEGEIDKEAPVAHVAAN